MQRRRVAFLNTVCDARRGLVLGDGDGRFLNAFVQAAPEAEVDALDSSPAMIALARRRTGPGRVCFHRADAREFAFAPGAYDVIVTHFFLDCLTDAEVARLVPRIAAATATGARWLVSEFALPAGGLARWRAAVWIWLSYRAFGWATGLRARRLPDYGAALRAAGFGLERAEAACGGLLVSQLWRRSTQPPKDPGREEHGIRQHAQGVRG